jgi:hypothetical protein
MLLRRNLLCGVGAVLLCSVLALAKGKPGGKPGGGGGDPPPAGTIFFSLWTSPHTMDTDGSNKTALPAGIAADGRHGPYLWPSHDLHDGHRWFVDVRAVSGTYPDGRARHELFAVRDDGLAVAQLTDQADLDPGDPDSTPGSSVLWTPGDGHVSFIARRWASGSVVEAGIYVAEIDYDAAGEVVGLVAQPSDPLVEATLITVGSNVVGDIGGHDWSPDGTQIVHNTALAGGGVAGELTVVDLGTGDATTFATSDAGGSPVWSPDGSTIAFGGGYDIWTISPDGTAETRILRRKGGRNPVSYAGPHWSPTGSHLILQGWGDILGGGRQDVYRAAADGSGKTNLTAEIDTTLGNGGTPAGPIAWR